MGLEEVLSKICADKNVNSAFLLEGEFYEEVIEEESSIIECTFGMPLDNRALKEIKTKEMAICIFCYGSFEPPSDHVMVMEDCCGNWIGHDVPSCKMHQYKKDDPDIIWLCDDFAIYPNRAVSHEMVMAMLPLRVKCVGESEGVKDPVIMYPATSTDIMLRKHFGIPLGDARIASAIMAFNIL
ncbi:hypothetical protein Mpt1_c05840 [Candidatus Methanoplasma termitum]|uniref:Uncharacterized protein n=1 Tax=Candidatus Methanoplasma termitum TaxID=1577791 RepID=A0A0A7LDS8_9ARCH|nr:hypothetical protein [Candidatus Methanoplasma termitum]AIZ56472.1 hypothetical protein Mpt1_c05840 [Candidatus Methanoplasma termitum]MCL2334037.1 hypothetical protein [Candidatus Methanoplasma sp.]